MSAVAPRRLRSHRAHRSCELGEKSCGPSALIKSFQVLERIWYRPAAEEVYLPAGMVVERIEPPAAVEDVVSGLVRSADLALRDHGEEGCEVGRHSFSTKLAKRSMSVATPTTIATITNSCRT
jgi:uncharacterized protein YbjT (DUF2867 family)